eukprot:GEZU01017081.1.p1 GENE.GEZU01017081.1~~GEZU01017081.1.p1  ORF type:complete len:137 (-),score=10.32 GEZU01017081.1:272-682(-)
MESLAQQLSDLFFGTMSSLVYKLQRLDRLGTIKLVLTSTTFLGCSVLTPLVFALIWFATPKEDCSNVDCFPLHSPDCISEVEGCLKNSVELSFMGVFGMFVCAVLGLSCGFLVCFAAYFTRRQGSNEDAADELQQT